MHVSAQTVPGRKHSHPNTNALLRRKIVVGDQIAGANDFAFLFQESYRPNEMKWWKISLKPVLVRTFHFQMYWKDWLLLRNHPNRKPDMLEPFKPRKQEPNWTQLWPLELWGRESRDSRLSFPATGPPDPGTDFKAPRSLTHHRFRHLLEGLSKGSWRRFEGVWKGPRLTPSKTFQKTFRDPFRDPFWHPSVTLMGSRGSVAGMKVLRRDDLRIS